MQSPCCHVPKGLRIALGNTERNRTQNPPLYCTNHRAWPTLLSLSNSIVFGVRGSLREDFVGLPSPLRKTLVAAVGMGVLTPQT